MKRQRKHQIRISKELSEYISKVNEAIDTDLDRAAQLVGYKSFNNLANQYKMSRYKSVPPPKCHKKMIKAKNLREIDGIDHESSITTLVEKILAEGGFKEKIELKKQFPHLHSLLDKGEYMEVVLITGMRLGDAERYLRGGLYGRSIELLETAKKAGMELEFKELARKIVMVGTKHQEREYR